MNNHIDINRLHIGGLSQPITDLQRKQILELAKHIMEDNSKEDNKLKFDNLSNIEKIEKNTIQFKNGKTIHTDNFTFADMFHSQEELEEFDEKVMSIFFDKPLKEDNIIYVNFKNKNK